LKTLAQRLISVVRPSDTAARLGGDEFAILLEDASQEEAEGVAQRLLAALAVPVKVGDREVKISASIGIAVPDGTSRSTAESLLRNADLAMYRAKARVQGSYAVYLPGMHEAALRRLELKADLQQAIEHDGLALDYQPIFQLAGGKAVAAEALLRWTHPDRGSIPAVETLALAEATGLMMPLGGWVMERACREVRRWRDELGHAADSLFISVNASARELLDPTYADLVAGNLARAGLPADALAIEITESDLMQESEAAIDALRRLKDLGVRLAVDDFGTGYSSLAYLARFPLDILKIDRTFVSSRVRTQDGQIARAIVDLARSLGLQVIAEGIEREEDRQLMEKLGAQLGQGFLMARPMSGDAALNMLRGLAAGRRRAPRRAPSTEVSPAAT
jgi:predicted signal transduction protein with EAL and GGDEF domain